VVLTFQGATPRIGRDVGKLLRPVVHKRMSVLTTEEDGAIYYQCGYRDGSPLPERQWVASLGISYDGDVLTLPGLKARGFFFQPADLPVFSV